MTDALSALRHSLAERLAALRGCGREALPSALLDVVVRRIELPGPGGDAFVVHPADWEALRHAEGGAGRPIPYWARPWPSGLALARALAANPPPAGRRVLELGCGLAVPSIVAARAGAEVLATDGATDAVAFAAHSLALNEADASVAHVDWAEHGDALAAQGPWDLVLAADVLYTRANVEALLRLAPRLLAPGGELRLADPHRAGGRDFLAAARARFRVWTHAEVREGPVALHALRHRAPMRGPT
jgi:predicted nicotinamide N-methyase